MKVQVSQNIWPSVSRIHSTAKIASGKLSQGQLHPSSGFRPRSRAPVTAKPSGALGQRPGEDPRPVTSTGPWVPAGRLTQRSQQERSARSVAPTLQPQAWHAETQVGGSSRLLPSRGPRPPPSPQLRPRAAAGGASCARRGVCQHRANTGSRAQEV